MPKCTITVMLFTMVKIKNPVGLDTMMTLDPGKAALPVFSEISDRCLVGQRSMGAKNADPCSIMHLQVKVHEMQTT